MSENDYTSEFGAKHQVRFLDPSQAKMYDIDGKEMVCKCGKQAVMSIMSKDAFFAECSECWWEGR